MTLAEVFRTITQGAHAVLALDGAGWHRSQALRVPGNITSMALPPYASTLDPIENVRVYLRAIRLAISVSEAWGASWHDCDARDTFANDTAILRSIATRELAKVPEGQSCSHYPENNRNLYWHRASLPDLFDVAAARRRRQVAPCPVPPCTCWRQARTGLPVRAGPSPDLPTGPERARARPMPFRSHMDAALAEARAAAGRGEVPVGAVVVSPEGRVVARAGNRTRELADPSAHAEMLAIRAACAAAGSERLPGHALYVTLEPCAMCAALIAAARIARLVYGAADPKSGGVAHGARVFTHPQAHHVPDVIDGVGEAEAAALLKGFFADRR